MTGQAIADFVGWVSGRGAAQLWGLLKTHRHSGRVDFRNGSWSWNAWHVPAEEARAAELLRGRGWRVEAPEGMGER